MKRSHFAKRVRKVGPGEKRGKGGSGRGVTNQRMTGEFCARGKRKG